MAYGIGGSRYAENKRAVDEKYLGPLIKTYMTRCIQCTRCVRYMTEVAGVEELGAIGRGEDMEITTYLERGMMSEMSANVVDLCPVGALTHRPWAFAARPWEMRKTESIDVMDAVGSAIRVDTRGREVVRILPRNNDAVNEEWISDKTRHVADGLRTQRLDRPYIRKNGRLEPAGWDEALALVAAKLKAAKPERIAAFAGDLAGAEEMFALKDLLDAAGLEECRMPAGRRQARPQARARELPVQLHHRGHRAGGRDPAHRHQSAARSGRAQRPHPQALAPGHAGRRADRGAGGSCIPLRVSGRRTADAEGGARRQAQLRRRAARCQAADGDRGRGRCGTSGRRGRAGYRGEDRAACRRTARTRAGTCSTCCTRLHRASRASISASCPAARARSTWARSDVAYLLGADELDMKALRQGLRDLSGQPRRCRRRARRRGAAGRRLHREERDLRQYRGPGAADGPRRVCAGRGQGGLGDRACALRAMPGRRCPTTRFPPCARPCTRTRPRWRASMRWYPRRQRGGGARRTRRRAGRRSRSAAAVRDFYLTNPIARASAVMAELSALKKSMDRGTTGTHG